MTVANETNNGSLDLTREPNLATTTALLEPSIQSIKFDDLARILLAFVLVGLLAFIIIITSIYAVTMPKDEPTIESYLKIVLSPIIGIVGSVVGFYFGARSASKGS
jgi:hypothetical protein